MKNRIKQFRKKLGLTQKQLAIRAGLPVTTLSNYELGKRQPPTDVLKKLADIFETNTGYLMGLTDAPPERITSQQIEDVMREVRRGEYDRFADVVASLDSEYGGFIEESSGDLMTDLISFYQTSAHNDAVNDNIEELKTIVDALRQLVELAPHTSFPEPEEVKTTTEKFIELQSSITAATNRIFIANRFPEN